jgi:caa(3)-type oxidase subunit IV
MHLMSAEEAKAHVRTYVKVFVTLLALTAVTVGVSYLQVGLHLTIAIALMVACTKGTLVALHFMHLSHEKKIIYATLALTGVFFIVLMTIGFY